MLGPEALLNGQVEAFGAVMDGIAVELGA